MQPFDAPVVCKFVRLRLLLGFVSFIASTAQAQSFHLVQAKLRWQGKGIGWAQRVPVSVEWQGRRQVLVIFEGEAARVKAEVRLHGLDGALLAGVGKPVTLEETDGWKITMAGGTWAPVAGGTKDWTEVHLPKAFPIKTGHLQASITGATGLPGSWEFPAVHDAVRALYGMKPEDPDPGAAVFVDQSRIFRRPGDARPWARAGSQRGDDGFVVNVLPDKRWVKVIFIQAGFALEGFARAHPRGREQTTLGTLSGSVSASVEDTMFDPGRWVWLEPGMSLFAKPGGPPEFAVIRKRTMAYQQIPADRKIAPEEIPATEFMLPIHEGDADLLLTGFLNVPHGHLKPVESPAPGAGYGSSGTSYDHWPPREY